MLQSPFQFNIFQLLTPSDNKSQHNHNHHEHFATVDSCTSCILWGLGHIKNAQYLVTNSEANIHKSWREHWLNSHANSSFSGFPDSFHTVFRCEIKFFLKSLKNPLIRECFFLRKVIPLKFPHCKVIGNAVIPRRLGSNIVSWFRNIKYPSEWWVSGNAFGFLGYLWTEELNGKAFIFVALSTTR